MIWQILWGPLSYLAAFYITKNSQFRHSVQALVSTGELYGNVLYLVTSLLDEYTTGRKYYRPEPLYFWVYFVSMNSIWLFIPGCKIWYIFHIEVTFTNHIFSVALYDSFTSSARSFMITDPPIVGKRTRKSNDASKKEKVTKVPASQESDTRSRRGGKSKKYLDDFSDWFDTSYRSLDIYVAKRVWLRIYISAMIWEYEGLLYESGFRSQPFMEIQRVAKGE